MSNIFISYSRKDLITAEKIINALTKDDLVPWVDWKSIPKGEKFEREIQQGIEEADVFLFLISPDSIQSNWCYKEIDHAVSNAKRIIPIVIRDTDSKIIHPEISKRNWIFNRDHQDDFNAAIEETLKTIQTNYEWVKYHTKLQVKALDWGRRKDSSRLLWGRELREAEEQFSQIGISDDPQPTDFQRQYILTSRRNEERQRRQISLGLSIGLIIMIILAVVAWNQRNKAVTAQATAVAESNIRATAQAQAEQQRNIALARQLGAQSNLLRQQDPHLLQLSTLLGVESLNHYPTLEGDTALRADLAILPKLEFKSRIAPAGNAGEGSVGISSLAFSPDGKWLVAGAVDTVFTIWDTTTWKEKRITTGTSLNTGVNLTVRAVVFSPDSHLLAVGLDDGVLVWDLNTMQEISQFGSGQVFSLAFTPDGKRLAYVGDNGIVVSDSNTGQTLYSIKGAFNIVKFSPDGLLGAAGGLNTTVVWNAETGTTLITKVQAKNPKATIQVIAFSLDGKKIATGEGIERGLASFPRIPGSGQVLIWEVATGKNIAEVNVPDETVSLQFSADNKQLEAGNVSGYIYIWDSTTGVQLNAIWTGSNVIDSVFMNHSQQIAYINGFGEAEIVDSVTGNEIAGMPIESNTSLSSMSLLESADMIATGDEAGNVLVWRLAGQETTKFDIGRSVVISSVVFSPDGNNVLVGAYDHTVRIINIGTGNFNRLINHSDRVLIARFSPDGKLAASGSQDGQINVWEVGTGKQLYKFSIGNMLGDLEFSPDSKFLAASEGSFPRDSWFIYEQQPIKKPTDVIIWNLTTSDEIARLHHSSLVNSIAFSPDGQQLAAASDDSKVHVWNIKTQTEVFQILHQNRVNLVTYNPDGKLGASAESCYSAFAIQPCAPFVKVWDAATGKDIWKVQLQAPWISNLLFSPNGQWLATSNEYIQGCPTITCQFLVQIWDSGSGEPVSVMAHANAIPALAFSPDSYEIASGGTDGTLKIWDPTNGKEISHITDIGEPWSVSFSPDGHTVAVGGYESGESYVRLLPIESDALIQMACARLTRNLTSGEWDEYVGDGSFHLSCSNIAERDTRKPNGPSSDPSFSTNGKFLLFQSNATNLNKSR
jgi:WD40 repeat protein